MAIKINDIPPEGLTLELSQQLDLFDEGTASTAVTAALKIIPVGDGIIQLTGRVQARPELECSRCLKRFPYSIDAELNIEASPVAAMGAEPEHELTGGELETDFYQGDEIDPFEFVKEQVLISVPMVPLHDPGCKGLCPTCGTDLNAATCGCSDRGQEGFSPFAELKDLFKK